MDGLGDEFLARARLTGNQHRGIRGCNLLRLAEHLSDDGAAADNFPVSLSDLDLRLEVVAFRLEPVLEPLDFGVGCKKCLLRLLPRRDIAKDTDRAEQASAGIARSDTGQVMDPLLPLGRMQIPILDREMLGLPVVHLLALVHKELAVVRMQMVHVELQRLEARVLARGNTAELLNSIVHEAGAFTIVHFVVTEAGQFCSHRQPSLAGTKRCFRALAFGDVD